MRAMKWLGFLVVVGLAVLMARSMLNRSTRHTTEQSKTLPTREIQVVLNPVSAKAAKLGPLDHCVAVTPDGIAVVGNVKGLWLVGGGQSRATGVSGLGCFTFTPEGLLMGVRGRQLVYLDARGQLKPLLRLPSTGMTLVPGFQDSLLLFGRDDKGIWDLYTIRPGRRVSLLLRSPRPITAAAETANHTLVVMDGALFIVENGKVRLLAGEPKAKLTALAADPAGNAIFVSDGRHIFRIEHGRPVVMTDDLGGTLRWQGGGLLVFDPRRPLLVRLVGVE